MGRAGRQSNEAGKALPAITNAGFFSDYYLVHRLDSGLSDLYAAWDAADKQGEPNARTRVRSLGTAFDRYRVDATLTAPDATALDAGRLELGILPPDGLTGLRGLNDAILGALGWAPDRSTVELPLGPQTVNIPFAHRRETPSGLLLLALETVFGTDPAAVVAAKDTPAGRLIEPVAVNGKPQAHTALEAAQLIFTCDEPPSYLLIVSGGAIVLLERERWGEGVFLGADIDEAVARGDGRPKGELAAVAALFSADAVDAGSEAQSVLTGLLERAAGEAAGVSKELRYGMRRSVELLARAVVADIRYRQKGAWRSIDAPDLTRECLRYLYRIIVLLFAEARPELGIVPTDDPDYQDGYGMSRLRDVALVELHDEQARNARHIQHSLDALFRLVNDGHAPTRRLDANEDVRELEFPGLRSTLFSPRACPLIDGAHLTDEILQQVIANLCFTQERAGRRRESVSYATLGINQLGAVYEGLMAYSGFLATEALYEVDKDGDPDNGSWVIPVDRADGFPAEVFLTEETVDGGTRRVTYREGDFVFRLASRDRERSASFYTPEVLTEFTVRHALDVLFAENPELRAADILELTVCEPALGSGAFLNEAINQLAQRYLKAAQDERGETIDPERYQLELQKAKAHFAVNQAYGVDLNQTAVELAEVSLWLNCMHTGLRAPWFGARLRRGNSLVGARRATYTDDQVHSSAWAGKAARPPADQRMRDRPVGSAPGIHHFLVPGQGWGAAAEAAEVRELEPAWVNKVNHWRARVHAKPTTQQVRRLSRLAARVEELWAVSAREVREFWEATRQHVDVWGTDTPPSGTRVGDEAVRRVLHDPHSATSRLRTLMDAWCSLWMWSPREGDQLPTFDEWLSTCEELLTVGQPWPEDSLFVDERALPSSVGVSIDEVAVKHPWLAQARAIAAEQTWFHWELELAPVFERGGFDLHVGNPPWVRPRWSDELSLAEHDPWFAVTSKISDDDRRARRAAVLERPEPRTQYLAERSENAALNASLGAVTREPLLAGQQTNLYLLFITGAWRRAAPRGSTALLHPDGHLSDPKAAVLREAAYRRYREFFHFINELKLFKEISDTRPYGVHVYGGDRGNVDFIQAAFLYHPAVVDRSLAHDGTGDLPGRKLPTNEWDIRPHRDRIVHVDEDMLAAWAELLSYPVPESAPVVKSVTTQEAAAVNALASYPDRVGSDVFFWSRGFDEYWSPRNGLLKAETHVPTFWSEVILQGPHFGICLPFAKQPRASGRHQQDYEPFDLEKLPESLVPRTNWKRQVPRDTFDAEIAAWNGRRHTELYRVAVRTMVPSNTYRSIFAALIPPDATTMSGCYVGGMPSENDTVLLCGMLSTLLTDFTARAANVANLHENVIVRFSTVHVDHALASPMLHRTLRLNCLTREFAPLWERLVQSGWKEDDFTAPEAATVSIASSPAAWSQTVPVRRELDRWLLLTDLDALGALILGVDADSLRAVYRAQFPVLQAYEHQMFFDAEGRQICGNHNAHGYLQAKLEAEAKEQRPRGYVKIWDRVLAYLDGDKSVDLGPFVPPFRRADREAAMTHAYWTFVDRYDLSPPDAVERAA